MNATVQPICRGGAAATLPVGRRCAGAAIRTAAQQRGPTTAVCVDAAAFTLIELLASITILLIVVSIMALIFTETDRAWRVGTGRADSNTEGRAAIGAIADDLQYALADDVLTFMMRPDTARGTPNISYNFTNSEICFVSLQGKPLGSDNERGTRSIYYWVRESTEGETAGSPSLGRYELMRTEINTLGEPSQQAKKPYRNPKWYEDGPVGAADRETYQSRGVIAENITALAFYAATTNNATTLSYDSVANSNRLPEYVDVMLELLSDEDAQRAAQLNARVPAEVGAFVDKNARRYVTRVYFQNRAGYKMR